MDVANKQGSCTAVRALIRAEVRVRRQVRKSVRLTDRCIHSPPCGGGCTCETSPIWRRSQARGRALMSVPSRSTCPPPAPPQHRARHITFRASQGAGSMSRSRCTLAQRALGTAQRNTAQTSHRATVGVVEPHDERHDARLPCSPGAPFLGWPVFRARTCLGATSTCGLRRGPAAAP